LGIIRANTEYKVTLSDFEGPLDLLLHVIRESKLDIKTVPLASVTSQYLSYLSRLDTLDLDLASEFIEVGTTLVEIKSRQILPKICEDAETAEEIEERLRAQLEEFKLLKEASLKLKTQENVDRFYKMPTPPKEIIKYTLGDLGMDDLIAAFTRVMHKLENKTADKIEEKKMRMDRFTVAEKVTSIRDRIKSKEPLTFFALFDEDFTRSEVINTFLALLELLKTGEVVARQDAKFSDIVIEGTDIVSTEEVGIEYNVVDGIND